MKINSHNEWDRLREIIVGSAERSRAVLTWTGEVEPREEVKEKAVTLAKQAYPEWFLEEINEDLDGLAKVIEGFDVKVFRPEVHNINRFYASPFWASTGNNIYNVRDLHLVVGNKVIESPSYLHSRYFEAMALYPIWYEYFEEGFQWISGPKPRLKGEVIQPYYRDENERVLTTEDKRHMELTGGRLEKLHKLVEDEILFEAANTVRMGKDLLYLVSCSGNHKGAKWLQSVLGEEYRVHITEDIYRSSHIDSTVMCLRPGLVMLNSTRVNEKNCPPIFDSWDKIWFEEVAPTSDTELAFQKEVREPIAVELESIGFRTNLRDMSSPWVGMNFLSIDPETVIVDERQKNLIKILENHKFKVVPITLRHIYTQGGGIHCATLDTVRDSNLESYFD